MQVAQAPFHAIMAAQWETQRTAHVHCGLERYQTGESVGRTIIVPPVVSTTYARFHGGYWHRKVVPELAMFSLYTKCLLQNIIIHACMHTYTVFCPGFQKGRVPSEKGTLAR